MSASVSVLGGVVLLRVVVVALVPEVLVVVRVLVIAVRGRVGLACENKEKGRKNIIKRVFSVKETRFEQNGLTG